MRFIVWYSERTGSNLLMSLLNKTGKLGVSDYENSGFFIGYGNDISQNTAGKITAFFDRQRTFNGIEACKLNFSYIDEMSHYIDSGIVYNLLHSFNAHIVLYRNDVVAQAVSWLIAQQTGIYSTLATDRGENPNQKPVYDEDGIIANIGKIKAHYARIETWLNFTGVKPLRLCYEKLIDDPEWALGRIAGLTGIIEHGYAHLDSNTFAIHNPYEAYRLAGFGSIKPHIRKQADKYNLDFIYRFKEKYEGKYLSNDF